MSASKKNIINWMRKREARWGARNGVIPGYAWDFVPGRSYDRRALSRKHACRKQAADEEGKDRRGSPSSGA